MSPIPNVTYRESMILSVDMPERDRGPSKVIFKYEGAVRVQSTYQYPVMFAICLLKQGQTYTWNKLRKLQVKVRCSSASCPIVHLLSVRDFLQPCAPAVLKSIPMQPSSVYTGILFYNWVFRSSSAMGIFGFGSNPRAIIAGLGSDSFGGHWALSLKSNRLSLRSGI